MIEIIIPLNLPVRAVAVSESTEAPPEWLAQEMIRWANRDLIPVVKEEPNQLPEEPQEPPPPSEIEIEREQLREQQAFLGQVTQELRHVTTLVEKRLDGMLHEFQLAAVDLAHSISAKLVFEAVNGDRFPIENLVHEVISRLDTHVNTVVRLHPDDLALVQQFPTIGSEEQSLQFVADSTLSRGDCKAKAGEISVVYELKRQIDEIRRQLLSTVDGHAES